MTTLDACEDLIKGYIGELEGGFAAKSSGAGCLVTTPFIRPDGESIEVELASELEGPAHLTDMGDTLGYLHVNGLTLSRGLLSSTKDICKQYGVSLLRSELVVEFDGQSGLGDALHRHIQAILSVTNLIQKRRPTGRVQFNDEVESLIIYSGAIYDTGFLVRGARSRYTIRFHINSDQNLLIHPLTASTEATALSWAERWAYRFGDIRVQNPDWRCVAVLDDRSQRREIWTDRTMAPLRDYAVLWREKERLTQILERHDQS